MAVTVTDRRGEVADADSITNWSSDQGRSGTVGNTQPTQIEGTGRIAVQYNRNNGNFYYSDGVISLDGDGTTTGEDEEASTAKSYNGLLIYAWVFSRGDPLSVANGGLGICIGDGTNRRSYFLAGGDQKGFSYDDRSPYYQCLLLDTSQLSSLSFNQDAGSAVTLSTITDVGFWADNGDLKSVGGVENYFYDIIRAGNWGLRVAGGTNVDRGTFTEIAAADNTQTTAYGIIRAFSTNVFGIQGPLTFGSTTTNSYFETDGFTAAWEDRVINDDKYFIEVEGNASSTNLFIIKNGTISSAGPALSMDFNGGNINTLQIESVTFNNTLGPLTFSDQADASGHQSTNNVFTGVGTTTVLSVSNININDVKQDGCSFNSCGQIIAKGTGNLENCNIVTSTVDSAVLVDDLSRIVSCNFVGDNTSHAVEIDVTTAINDTSVAWSSTYDNTTYSATDQASNATSTAGDSEVLLVNVASGQTLTIEVAAGADTPTYRNIGPGTVSIIETQTFTITNIEPGTEIRFIRDSDGTNFAGIEDVSLTNGDVNIGSSVVCSDDGTKRKLVYTFNASDSSFDTSFTVKVYSLVYEFETFNISNLSVGGSQAVSQRVDRNYINL